MKNFLFVALVVLALTGKPAMAADIEGAHDHPLISRFAGSDIIEYQVTDYDETKLPITKIDNDDAVPPEALVPLEGKITAILYKIGAGKSSLEIMRNYEQALNTAGFKPVFSCTSTDCGSNDGLYMGVYINSLKPASFDSVSYSSKSRYMLARRQQGTEDIYALIYVAVDESNNYTKIFEQIVEKKPMQTNQVTVLNADQLQQSLTAKGSVSVYGIYFDTAKADIKPDSQAAIAEMLKLMQANPDLKIYIVGHTDNVGTLPANLQLSQLRANAVVKALVAGGVKPERLVGKGVASLAPVASNNDEPGRALNRRVELVVQ